MRPITLRPRRPGGGLVALVVVLALAAACSAPVDSGPKTLRAASIPSDLRGETTTTATTILSTGESEEATVYFIKNDPTTLTDRQGRPMALIPEGAVIPEVLA